MGLFYSSILPARKHAAYSQTVRKISPDAYNIMLARPKDSQPSENTNPEEKRTCSLRRTLHGRPSPVRSQPLLAPTTLWCPIYTKIRTTMRKIAPNINQHANQASSSSSSSSSSSRPGINAPIAPVAKFRAHTTVPPRSATTAAASSTSGVASSAASEPAPPKSDPCGKS